MIYYINLGEKVLLIYQIITITDVAYIKNYFPKFLFISKLPMVKMYKIQRRHKTFAFLLVRYPGGNKS